MVLGPDSWGAIVPAACVDRCAIKSIYQRRACNSKGDVYRGNVRRAAGDPELRFGRFAETCDVGVTRDRCRKFVEELEFHSSECCAVESLALVKVADGYAYMVDHTVLRRWG